MKKKNALHMWKRIGAGALAFVMAFSAIPMYGNAAEPNASLDENLLGWYSFDEDTVNFEGGTVKNLADGKVQYDGALGALSGNQTSAISKGEGVFGASLHFEGKNAENYFRIPQIINTAKDYTVSLWIKFKTDSDTSGTSTNIVQQTGAGRTLLMVKNHKLGTYVSGQDVMAEEQVSYGEWKHVVISGEKKDESKTAFDIYVNGEKVVDQDMNLSSLTDALTDLQFGCHKNANTGYSFTGDIDSVRIYNAASDEERVQALFSEHGNAVIYPEIVQLIQDAEKLLEEGEFLEEEPEYRELSAAISRAKEMTPESSFEELMGAKQSLEDCMNAYEEALSSYPVTIKIDPDEVVQEIPDYMFGVNHRYHMDGYGSWDAENDCLFPEFKELSDSAKFGSIRYPGGIVSNLFQWKRSIGEDRETTIHGNWDEPSITPNFGVDEAASYIIDDLGGEMIYVYNFGNGSAQDAADLVEYLNCEVGENPNGGIDWAQVRADNGHPQPYGVTQFEIGNEVDEGRGYWMQDNPNQWSGGGEKYAKMYAEGARRTYTKEKVAEFDNWNTTNDKTKASNFSDGTANQKKYMRYANDVTDQEDKSKMVERDSVHVYVADKEWKIVDDLSKAGKEDVVEVNCENGEILFGDGVNGNIPANGSDIRVTYTVQKDGIADYYDAMKAVDPDVKLYSGFSNVSIAKAIYESEKAGADGGKFDGIAVHPYSRTNGQIQDSDPQFYEKILSAIDTSVVSQIESRQRELNKYWPDGSKNVCISEYGIFNHSGDVVQSQTHAIYIAENLMRFVKLHVAYTNKHCLIDFPGVDVLGPGKQALILANDNGDGTYSYYGTPSLETMKIFNTMSSTKVLKTEIKNNHTFYNEVKSIDSMVTKDDEGNIYIIAVNMERNHTKKINMVIDGRDLTGAAVKGMKLESEDVYSMNSLENPDNVKAEEFDLTCEGTSLTYEMQPHSIAAFLVTKETEEPTEGISTEVLEYALTLTENVSTEGVLESVVERYHAALTNAKDILAGVNEGDTTVTQDMVDHAWQELIKAMQYLSFKQGDKSDLEKVVALAADIEERLDTYLDDGKQAFTDALTAARKTLTDGDAMQEEVNEAWRGLLEAMANLRLKPDKSALENLINEASALSEDAYETESFGKMRTALAKAQEVFADEHADQRTVTAAEENLKDAVAKLVPVSEGVTSEENDTVTEAADKQANAAGTTAPTKADNATAGSTAKSVKTGDGAEPVAAAAVMAVAMAAVAVVWKKRTSHFM